MIFPYFQRIRESCENHSQIVIYFDFRWICIKFHPFKILDIYHTHFYIIFVERYYAFVTSKTLASLEPPGQVNLIPKNIETSICIEVN